MIWTRNKRRKTPETIALNFVNFLTVSMMGTAAYAVVWSIVEEARTRSQIQDFIAEGCPNTAEVPPPLFASKINAFR